MARKIYPLRRPKFADGIRSQESRAGSGRAEWAKKWFAALERIDLGGRFGRGRNYAMSGQVTSLEIAGNIVRAEVQGMRAERYRITIDFRQPSKAARARIVSAIRREPILVARLLAGEMPMEVERIFRDEGYDLYPGAKLSIPEALRPSDPEALRPSDPDARRYDTVTACSCPDYANPCKHVFAALIVLGEEVARRPSLLVELRGIRMEDLI